MSIYFEFAKKSFQQRFIYRANSIVFILSSLVRMFIQISVWYALLGSSRSVNNVTISDMVSFVIINLMIDSLIYSNIANCLAEKVQDGTIANDFLRPVSLKYYLFSEQLGQNIFQTVFNTLPVCIVGIFFFKFHIPNQPFMVMLFFISICLGVIIMFYVNYILGLFSFWFKTSFYVNWFLAAFFSLFAGTVVPFWFYPSWLYTISKFLPFHLISFEPISIYLGRLSLKESQKIILFQFLWLMLLIILEKFIWQKAQKIVTVQGG